MVFNAMQIKVIDTLISINSLQEAQLRSFIYAAVAA